MGQVARHQGACWWFSVGTLAFANEFGPTEMRGNWKVTLGYTLKRTGGDYLTQAVNGLFSAHCAHQTKILAGTPPLMLAPELGV
jgi:hypothetical protein